MTTHRICWRFLDTGALDHGPPLEQPLATLQAWVNMMNRKHPDMFHWIEIEPID